MSGTATAPQAAQNNGAVKSKNQLLDEVVQITEDMRVKLGKRWGIPPSRVFTYGEQFISLSKSCPPDFRVSPDLIAQFLQLAAEHDLNPARYEIRAFYDYNKGLQTFVMIDGWTTLANRQPAYDGTEFEYERDKDGTLVAITSLVYRKDRTRPTRTRVKMSEWRVGTSPQWQMKPEWMLEGKAFKQGQRRAFGFAGVLDDDDLRQMGFDAPEPTKPTAPRTTVADLKPSAPPPDDEYSRPTTPAAPPREHVNTETGEITPAQNPAASGDAKAPQTGQQSQPAEQASPDELEADVITANTKIFYGILGGKRKESLWRDMSDEQRQSALDSAKHALTDANLPKADRARNLGIVNFIEAKLKEIASK